MTEGFIVQKICEIRRICFGCDHYKHDLIRSGSRPVYRDSCTHPIAVKNEYGGGSQYFDVPILDDHTPDWCPAGERPAVLIGDDRV